MTIAKSFAAMKARIIGLPTSHGFIYDVAFVPSDSSIYEPAIFENSLANAIAARRVGLRTVCAAGACRNLVRAMVCHPGRAAAPAQRAHHDRTAQAADDLR